MAPLEGNGSFHQGWEIEAMDQRTVGVISVGAIKDQSGTPNTPFCFCDLKKFSFMLFVSAHH